MKFQRMVFILFSVLFIVSSASVVSAGDFDWMRDLNIRAEADPSGFRAQVATRFNIGDVQVKAVIGNVDRPADAYMVFRLAEMAGVPPERVVEKYKAGKGKGWGALAQSLGIKPGSKAFHALKQGHDLKGGSDTEKGKEKGKGKGKGKG